MTLDDGRKIDRAGPFGPGVAPARAHLDRIVSGEEDTVRCRHEWQETPVHPRAEPGGPESERIIFRQDALGLVGRDQGYAEAVAERGDGPFGLLCQDIETGDHERALRFREPRAGRIQHRARGRRHRRGGRARDRRRCGLLPGLHIDRDVEEHRARPASGRNGDRLVGEDGGHPVLDAKCRLGDRFHQPDMVEHLVGVAVLFARGNAARQGDHRHAVLEAIGDDVYGVGDARADRRDQDCRGEIAVMDPFAHEAGAILVFGEHDPDAGAFERVHDCQHFAARDAECIAAAGLGQAPGDQVCGTSHGGPPDPRLSPGGRIREWQAPPRSK